MLDEEEFAKQLIPELFKHRNYASFVRQLNMYGFHKKVGLSDNSMRASERKNKNPSEYSNPYFKRGRPNLLWLIKKPQSSSTKASKGGSRTKQEEYDEEVDETIGRDNSPLAGDFDNFDDTSFRPGRQNLLTLGPSPNTGGLPKDQLASVQSELQQIRDNQHKIAQMLNEVRREHKQLYGQAKAFHDLHEKHDNSINAILTFLATVYQKKMEDDTSMGDMFRGSIPTEQSRGNVVEMGDFRAQSVDSNTPRPFQRRCPLLLEDKKSPMSPTSPGDNHLNTKSYNHPSNDNLHSPTIQELSDNSGRSTPSPNLRPQSKDTSQIPQADIMSMLNASNNAFSPTTPMDFTEALSRLQNSGGNTPLTPGQRQNMLQLMGDEYQPSHSPSNINNALTSYSNNAGTTFVDPAAQFDATGNSLEHLGDVIREQGKNIDSLSNTLTPLSPSGSIPGIGADGMGNVPYPLGPGNQDLLDLDNIFNTDGYFNDAAGKDGGDFNFDGANFDFGDAGGNLGAEEAGAGDFGNGGDGGFKDRSAGVDSGGGGDANAGAQEESDDTSEEPKRSIATAMKGDVDTTGLESSGKRRRVE